MELWVATNSKVGKYLAEIFRRGERTIIVRISSADTRSRSPVGSSATRMVGSVTMARAMATRCCSSPDISAVRLVDPGQEVQEGRFPGTGWSHQRQEFPLGDVKGDIVQDRDGEVFPVIGLEDVPDFYDESFRFGQINSLRAQDNFRVHPVLEYFLVFKQDQTGSIKSLNALTGRYSTSANSRKWAVPHLSFISSFLRRSSLSREAFVSATK